MVDGLIIEKVPPPNRQGKCAGGLEWHLTEAAVMLAFASHLLNSIPNVRHVSIHPDGEHAKRFDIHKWLEDHDFKQTQLIGKTGYSGIYDSDGKTISVTSQPGKGDIEAEAGGQKIVAECKGGITNTKHSGQLSRLRRGLCEAVGLLMVRPEDERQIAVVPYTNTTLQLAQNIINRTNKIGIEIALVDGEGNVTFVMP